MKKLFLIALAVLLMAGVAFANSEIASSDNAVIFGPTGGPKGITAPVEVMKCYLGSAASCSVGDVVTWNTTAVNGYTVDRAAYDYTDVTYAGYSLCAGVMVTTTSQVSSASATSPKASGPNVGYMAIRGFCAAKVDTSESETGKQLAVNGGTLAASFETADTAKPSEDIGVLLMDSGADGLMRVWLRM